MLPGQEDTVGEAAGALAGVELVVLLVVLPVDAVLVDGAALGAAAPVDAAAPPLLRKSVTYQPEPFN